LLRGTAADRSCLSGRRNVLLHLAGARALEGVSTRVSWYIDYAKSADCSAVAGIYLAELLRTMFENERFQSAISCFDSANNEDPRRVVYQDHEYPYELLYAQRMTHWLERLAPRASEVLRLAARSQHICRWQIPRSEYPLGRAGYHRWRTRLYGFHAEKAAVILREVGYDEESATRVAQMLQKENLKSDPEMQLLEDMICLVFLENYFAEFSKEHEPAKVVGILRKTWGKMSPQGREAAVGLKMSAEARQLLDQALSGVPNGPGAGADKS
jgi:hypothetical protein